MNPIYPTTNTWSARSPRFTFPSLTPAEASISIDFSSLRPDIEAIYKSDTEEAAMDPVVLRFLISAQIKTLEKEMKREENALQRLLNAPTTHLSAPTPYSPSRTNAFFNGYESDSERKEDGAPYTPRAQTPSLGPIYFEENEAAPSSTAPFTPQSIDMDNLSNGDYESDRKDDGPLSRPLSRAHTPSVIAPNFFNNAEENEAAPSSPNGVGIGIAPDAPPPVYPRPRYGDQYIDESSYESTYESTEESTTSSSSLNYSQTTTESWSTSADVYSCSDPDYEYHGLTNRQTMHKLFDIWAAPNDQFGDEPSDSEYTDSGYSASTDTDTNGTDSDAQNSALDMYDGADSDSHLAALNGDIGMNSKYDIMDSIEFIRDHRGRFQTMIELPSDDEVDGLIPDLDDLRLLSGMEMPADVLVPRGQAAESHAQIPLFDR